MLARVFVPAEKIIKYADRNETELAGDNAHHIVNVLRMNIGDLICVADGEGNDYLGEITLIEAKKVKVLLNSPVASKGESRIDITLFQSLPKANKMDYIVEKATEIGVKKITLVCTDRSVVKKANQISPNKVKRWHKISKSAARQAQRGVIPEIAQPMLLKDAVSLWRKKHDKGVLIVPWEKANGEGVKGVLKKVNPHNTVFGVLIGPEGGFTKKEIDLAIEYGGHVCTLGPRILRTETAGIIVSALVLYEFNEMGE